MTAASDMDAAQALAEAEARSRFLAESLDLDAYFARCAEAAAARPDDLLAAGQYAEALGHVGRAADKRAYLERLLATAPEDVRLNVNYGLELLMEGRHRDAWRHYAYRARLKNVMRLDAGLPEARRWRGEQIGGKNLVLVAEQGLGDALQFVRYAIRLQGYGARAYLNVQPALRPLLQGSPALGVVMDKSQTAQIHHWANLIDLLPVLEPTRADIAWPGAYVAPPARPAPVAALGGARGLRVGLAWRGNPKFASDFARSLPVEALAPFRDVARCSFFSLMAPEHSAAIAAAGHGDWLTDLAPVTSPFEDLARVVAGLDVVVTICTSVAHLAGAMGKPTFLMLSRTPDWRWGREGAETPWYPSVRIFRQRRFGRWDDVIADVAAALGAL